MSSSIALGPKNDRHDDVLTASSVRAVDVQVHQDLSSQGAISIWMLAEADIAKHDILAIGAVAGKVKPMGHVAFAAAKDTHAAGIAMGAALLGQPVRVAIAGKAKVRVLDADATGYVIGSHVSPALSVTDGRAAVAVPGAAVQGVFAVTIGVTPAVGGSLVDVMFTVGDRG